MGYTLLVGEELRFEPDKLAATITTYDSGLVIHTVEALGGIGDITYARVSANPPALAANFNVGSDNARDSYSTTINDADNAELIHPGVREHWRQPVCDPAVDGGGGGSAAAGGGPWSMHRAVFLTGETRRCRIAVGIRRRCALIPIASGGDFAVGADGLLSLASAQSNVATLTATVTIEDSHDNTAPVNAFLTLTIAEGVSFVPSAFDLRLTTYANSVPFTLHRANLLGGLGTRSYALVSTNPSNFDANITVDSGGDIIVTQTISNVGNAGIYVRGSAEYGGAATCLCWWGRWIRRLGGGL